MTSAAGSGPTFPNRLPMSRTIWISTTRRPMRPSCASAGLPPRDSSALSLRRRGKKELDSLEGATWRIAHSTRLCSRLVRPVWWVRRHRLHLRSGGTRGVLTPRSIRRVSYILYVASERFTHDVTDCPPFICGLGLSGFVEISWNAKPSLGCLGLIRHDFSLSEVERAIITLCLSGVATPVRIAV